MIPAQEQRVTITIPLGVRLKIQWIFEWSRLACFVFRKRYCELNYDFF